MDNRRNIPYTTSELVDSDDRRVVDLSPEGFPEIPVLGKNYSSFTTEGSDFHRHRKCVEITLCTRGSARFDCDGKVYTLMPGMVFVSRPQDVHRLRTNQRGARLYWMFFRVPQKGTSAFGLPQLESEFFVHELMNLPRHAFTVNDDVRLAFEDLFSVLDNRQTKKYARSLRMRMAALRLLHSVVLAGHAEPEYSADKVFLPLLETMRRHPEENYDGDRLVRETGLSPNTILARFRKLTGLPPQAFLVKCRIHRAKELLVQRKNSITEIAGELGFSSSQHFATRFRQETGMTPKMWRMNHGYEK